MRFVKNKNGSVSSKVTPVSDDSLDSSEEKGADEMSPNQFSDNLLKIQQAASRLVGIQQLVKASGGKITEEEKKTYAESLDSLGQAAQALAKMNESHEEDDFRALINGKLRSENC